MASLQDIEEIVVNYSNADVTDALNLFVESLIELQEEIDSLKPIPRPADPIKSVLFNPAKGTTTVVWNTGDVTVVHCNNEEYDPEKGLAMCFMKRAYENRGCFNEFLRKWVGDENSYKKPKKKKSEDKFIKGKDLTEELLLDLFREKEDKI